METIRDILRPKKLAVCTAWGSPFAWTHAAYNMANLNRPKGVDVKFFPGFGWCPARRHLDGVERALKWGATHVCFLGADQLHPLDVLEKLCEHLSNGYPVAAGLVPSRGWVKGLDKPFQKIGYKVKDKYRHQVSALKFSTEYLELVDIKKDYPYVEIMSTGSGVIAFDINLLDNMEKPWFFENIDYPDKFDRSASMDTTFVWRLNTEAGGKTICDLTIDVAHMDVFPIDESYGDRFMDWPKWRAHESLHRYL